MYQLTPRIWPQTCLPIGKERKSRDANKPATWVPYQPALPAQFMNRFAELLPIYYTSVHQGREWRGIQEQGYPKAEGLLAPTATLLLETAVADWCLNAGDLGGASYIREIIPEITKVDVVDALSVLSTIPFSGKLAARIQSMYQVITTDDNRTLIPCALDNFKSNIRKLQELISDSSSGLIILTRIFQREAAVQCSVLSGLDAEIVNFGIRTLSKDVDNSGSSDRLDVFTTESRKEDVELGYPGLWYDEVPVMANRSSDERPYSLIPSYYFSTADVVQNLRLFAEECFAAPHTGGK